MNIKWIALAGCLGYGLWFAVIGGRQVAPEHVESLYREYASAFDRGDGKAVCGLFGDAFHGRFSSTSRTMKVKEVVNKATACTAVDDFAESRKKMEEAAGHELHTNIEYTIQSITIAPDKKSATAQVLLEMRVGTAQGSLLDMRSTQTDVIRRSFGHARFEQSDGSVSFFK